MSFSYSLHAKWEGVWEIHGNSARNGDRMIITFSAEKKCILTEARSLETYTLSAEPQNNLKAHWNKRSSGKVHRYSIGNLSHAANYDEIEWSEMRKNRKVKWIRIDSEPTQYLQVCEERNKKKPKYKSHRSIIKRKANQMNHSNGNNHSNYHLTPISNKPTQKQKYVLKKQSTHKSPINDPAIVDMIEYNNENSSNNNHHNNNNNNATSANHHNHNHNHNPNQQSPNYQTEHRPLKNNQFYVDRYPKPRRTVLRHDQVHESRQRDRNNRNKGYRMKEEEEESAAVLDAYFTNSNSSLQDNYKKKEKEMKLKRQRRRDRRKFSKYLLKTEVDRILEETKTFKNPVLYMGEISVSRFNPNIAYVNVDGLDRDVRISGFVDRNRAFHGDTVVISIYPQIEWMSAIKPEIKEFQDRLDKRDRMKQVEAEAEVADEDEEEEEAFDDEEDITLDGYNASSSSSSSVEERAEAGEEEEAEIIYLDEDEEKEKEKEKEREKEMANAKKKRRGRRLEDLVDRKSITAYDYYLFLKDAVSDFAEFENKWRDRDLMETSHPRRGYIDQVMDKCGGVEPLEALASFEWSNPSDFSDEIARGRVLAIYSSEKSTKDKIPGFLQPIIYNDRGAIDRKWAQFTPSDKRYPKAMFPMRELPSSLRALFGKFEKEEMCVVEEYENRLYDLRKQGLRHKSKEINKRSNRFADELKLHFLNMYFEARWPHHSFMPICHLVCELGKRGAVEVETNVILSRHNIGWREKFTDEIEAYVSKLEITESDYAGRRDCRSLRVFSIDPTTARDFDDALSIELLTDERDRNGLKLYNVGIHIADVTHFVSPGSVVDIEAAHRATSVYMVDRCLPMLPHHLCQNLCSLNCNVDRLAYSVFVILNENGCLVHREGRSPWFGKTVIRSRARLNYETAHWMLTDRVTGDTPLNELDECCQIASDQCKLSDIVSDVKLFWSIAKPMRERRFASGSVQFFRPRIRFRLDKKDQHKALLFGPEILLWSNHLIEEMMLLANQLVAHRLMRSAIKEHTVLRRHPPPLKEKGMKLQLICRSQGLQLMYETPKQLNESLQAMQATMYGGISADKVINALLAQSMQKAQYIVVEDTPPFNYAHWALNFPMYTHFTSPIRRYADVMVHRLLSYALDNDENDGMQMPLPPIHEVKSQCSKCNVRNAAAHFAQIESQLTHLCLLLIERPVIVEAMVIDIISNKMFILVVPGLGIDVRVNINDVIQESAAQIVSIHKEFELPDSVLNIEWKSGDTEQYKLFDKMRIQLSSRLKIPIKLVTKIIEPHKRKDTKPANADAINKQKETEETEEAEEAEEEEYKTNDEPRAPVAMTLDSQLKVGTSDFYAGYYD